jgi:ankyrin repeat protein
MALVEEGQTAVLRVRILEGRNLTAMDRSGLSDPFVVVVFGNNKMKTKHMRQTLDPAWTSQDRNQFEFKVDSRVPGIIQFEVFDWNRVAASKRMGYVEITNLKKRLDGGKKAISKWFPLQSKKPTDKFTGDLKVEIELEITARKTQVSMAADGMPVDDGESPLESAIRACDLERVKTELKSTENINQQDRYGYTPLHAAAVLFAENDAEVLCAVLEHPDIDVNLENTDKNTPLHYFCSKYRSPNCGDAFRIFVKKGADVNKQNRTGETPMHKAMFNASVRTILLSLLIEAGADVNKQTEEFKETALHYAVRLEREDLISMLLEAGADLSLKTKEGRTALDLAQESKKNNIIEKIEEAQEVYDWLAKLGLQKYGPLFIKEGMAMEILPDLDADALDRMGVETTGHRVKLLNAAKELKAGDGKVEGKKPAKKAEAGVSKTGSSGDIKSEKKTEEERSKALEAELEQMKYLKKSDWVLQFSDLEYSKQIGTGAAGIVYRGMYQGVQDVAIKVLKSDQSEKEEDEFKKEFQIMSSIEHPNLVFFFGAVLHPRLCMVLEFCQKGALYDVLVDPKTNLNWETLFSYAKDMTRGLMALHEWDPQIVHRDFKSLNLLVNNDDVVKVADFGLSRFNTETQKDTLVQMRGTFAYVSPEVYHGEKFSTKSDVFSVSLVLWELVERCVLREYQRPYAEFKHLQFDFQIIIQTAKNDLRPTISKQVPKEFNELIVRTWAKEADTRPECRELLEILEKMEATYLADPQEWDALIKPEGEGEAAESGEAGKAGDGE